MATGCSHPLPQRPVVDEHDDVVGLARALGLELDRPVAPQQRWAGHRRDLNVVTSSLNLTPELSNAGDFSRSSIPSPGRLRGRDEPGIGGVDAPGLRFGTTAADVEPVAAAG